MTHVMELLQSRPVVLTLVIWTLIWKGLALWKAADRKEKWWFIALLVVNTLGILEMLYLFVFSQIEKKKADNTIDSSAK